MFKKSYFSCVFYLAIAAIMVVSLAGCEEGTTVDLTSTDGGSFTRVSNPTGTVTGTVQDTNGNPLSGVSVYLAGMTATTDAGGVYVFNNVPVSDTVGADHPTTNQVLSITIMPPAGYLGATVTVTPEAQIDSPSGGGGEEDTTTTFIDGYLASAGVAVLPALGSTVSGVLRSNTTGEPIAATDVNLDMELTNTVAQQQVQNGVTTTYQTLTYTATTGADGSFTITGVPNDSELRFVVAGYAISNVVANTNNGNDVVTTDEVDEVYVGNVFVTPILALDIINPFVASVTGVIDQTAGTGMFNDNINSIFYVNFSEPMADLVNTNSVYLRDTTNDAYITLASTPTLSADGMTLTVTASAAITAGAVLHLNLLRADFQDMAYNAVALGAGVGYDTIVASSTGTQYVRLTLQIFEETNTNATSVTLAQMTKDITGTDDNPLVQAVSVSFNDVNDNTAGFQQLNSADDDDNLSIGDSDAADRLTDLATALNFGTGITVNTDVARVTFDHIDATSYDYEVFTAASVNKTDSVSFTWPVHVTDDAVNDNIEIDSTFSNTVEVALDGVEPGDILIITPIDDFGYPGTATSLALVDNVEPTTALQLSYGVTPTENGVQGVKFGEGGELSEDGDDTIGKPILNVTPKLLDELSSSGESIYDGMAAPYIGDNQLTWELFDMNMKIDPLATVPVAYIGRGVGVYDATAYDSWTDLATVDTLHHYGILSRKIGAAFTEDVTLTGAPAYDGTVGLLSGWVANNDVTVQDDKTTVNNVDLVDFVVDNVFTLAADDGSLLDFTDVVDDNAGNTASVNANAGVVIRDAMPPMIEYAVYNGYDLVVKFNEQVVLTTDTEFIFYDAFPPGTTYTISPTQDTVDDFNTNTADYTEGFTKVTIPYDDWDDAIGFPYGTYFTLGSSEYDETVVPNLSAQGNNAYGHARFAAWNIEDLNGNNWIDDHAGMNVPQQPAFAIIDSTGDFSYTATPTILTKGVGNLLNGDTFQIQYDFSHAIRLSELFDGVTDPNANSLTAQQVFDHFNIDSTISGSGATINNAVGSLAVLTNSNKRLTVTVQIATADMLVDDRFQWDDPTLGNVVESDYDETKTVNIDDIVVQ